MSFLHAGRLWLLLLVVAIAGVYVFLQFHRRSFAVRFTNVELLDSVAPRRPGWRRHIPAAMFLLGIGSMVVAWAQPVRQTQVPRERATIIMAIDTSLSMQAADVEPSRIDGAKEAAAAFLDSLPERINVGLVTFNGIATVRVPPTTDRETVAAAVEGLELDEATATGEAIFAGLTAVESVLPDETGSAPPARIVLMSDGERTVGRSEEEAVDAAQAAAVPVSTIALGTERGVIEIPDLGVVPVPVNEQKLQEIADGTGGEFFTAETTSELTRVYENIGSSVGFETEDREVTVWFVGGAVIAMLLTAAFSLAWFSRLP